MPANTSMFVTPIYELSEMILVTFGQKIPIKLANCFGESEA